MRRRLDLAASLITRPALIFLDEPTTGLDPRTRSQMWDAIRDLVADGSTTVQPLVPVRDVLSQITTLAWRALIKMVRNPEQLVDVTFMPILFTVMSGLIFSGAISGSLSSYLPTLIPGIIAMTTITACVGAGTQLREDMDKV